VRENWLSNRIFTSYATILNRYCVAWNWLVAQPWTIMSIGLRDWINAGASAPVGISHDAAQTLLPK
jgi:hypothetical protein